MSIINVHLSPFSQQVALQFGLIRRMEPNLSGFKEPDLIRSFKTQLLVLMSAGLDPLTVFWFWFCLRVLPVLQHFVLGPYIWLSAPLCLRFQDQNFLIPTCFSSLCSSDSQDQIHLLHFQTNRFYLNPYATISHLVKKHISSQN